MEKSFTPHLKCTETSGACFYAGECIGKCKKKAPASTSETLRKSLALLSAMPANRPQQRGVTLTLTDDEARLIYQQADGWLDAGTCEGGLTEAEADALRKLCAQIRENLASRGRRPM